MIVLRVDNVFVDFVEYLTEHGYEQAVIDWDTSPEPLPLSADYGSPRLYLGTTYRVVYMYSGAPMHYSWYPESGWRRIEL